MRTRNERSGQRGRRDDTPNTDTASPAPGTAAMARRALRTFGAQQATGANVRRLGGALRTSREAGDGDKPEGFALPCQVEAPRLEPDPDPARLAAGWRPLGWFRLAGDDTMEPEFSPGDRVFVEAPPAGHAWRSGEVVFARPLVSWLAASTGKPDPILDDDGEPWEPDAHPMPRVYLEADPGYGRPSPVLAPLFGDSTADNACTGACPADRCAIVGAVTSHVRRVFGARWFHPHRHVQTTFSGLSYLTGFCVLSGDRVPDPSGRVEWRPGTGAGGAA